MLNAHSKVGITQIALTAPAIVLAIFLLFRHGRPRMAWALLLLFSGSESYSIETINQIRIDMFHSAIGWRCCGSSFGKQSEEQRPHNCRHSPFEYRGCSTYCGNIRLGSNCVSLPLDILVRSGVTYWYRAGYPSTSRTHFCFDPWSTPLEPYSCLVLSCLSRAQVL